ncbi:MAG: uncharacterized protein KVP18_000423 [Porospora cf. gigantea A]|uniref:uncharacterized protein n=1 Tax=Porospora cf. gigantea A TaxID=2853593 RepID=UPI003559B5E2|nr:MAG: hypothetical protein KVP18_000423 [Porospora cf. gigantea A]
MKSLWGLYMRCVVDVTVIVTSVALCVWFGTTTLKVRGVTGDSDWAVVAALCAGTLALWFVLVSLLDFMRYVERSHSEGYWLPASTYVGCLKLHNRFDDLNIGMRAGASSKMIEVPPLLQSISTDAPPRFVKLADLRLLMYTYSLGESWRMLSLCWNVGWMCLWLFSTGYWRRDSVWVAWDVSLIPWDLEVAQAIFVIGGMFDFAFKTVAQPSLTPYLLSLSCWVEITALPPALIILYYTSGSLYMHQLGWLRWLRLFMIVRLMSFDGLSRDITKSRLVQLCFALGILLLSFASAEFTYEGVTAAGVVTGSDWSSSFVEWMYFAIVTLSTVGYGDMSPQTAEGRVLCSIFIIMLILWIPNELSHLSELNQRRTTTIGQPPRDFSHCLVVVGGVSQTDLLHIMNEVELANDYGGDPSRVKDIVVVTPEDRELYRRNVDAAASMNIALMIKEAEVGVGGSIKDIFDLRGIHRSKGFIVCGDHRHVMAPWIASRQILSRMLALKEMLPPEKHDSLALIMQNPVEKRYLLAENIRSLVVVEELRNALLVMNTTACQGIIAALIPLFHHFDGPALRDRKLGEASGYGNYLRGVGKKLFRFTPPHWAHAMPFRKIVEIFYHEFNVLVIGLLTIDPESSWDLWLNCSLDQTKRVDASAEYLLVIARSPKLLAGIYNCATSPRDDSSDASDEDLECSAESDIRQLITRKETMATMNSFEFCPRLAKDDATVFFNRQVLRESVGDARLHFADPYKPLLLICGSCLGMVDLLHYYHTVKTHNVVMLASSLDVLVDAPLEWGTWLGLVEGIPTETRDLKRGGVFEASRFLILPLHLDAAGATSTTEQDRSVLVTHYVLSRLVDVATRPVTLLLNHSRNVEHMHANAVTSNFLGSPAFAASTVLSDEMLTPLVLQHPALSQFSVDSTVFRVLLGLTPLSMERNLLDPTAHELCPFNGHGIQRSKKLDDAFETFGEAFDHHFRNHHIVIGLYRRIDSDDIGPHFLSSPDQDFVLNARDRLLLLPPSVPLAF